MLLTPLLALACTQGVAAPDTQALATFHRLTPGEQKDLADYFRLEASRLGTFQASLLAYVLEQQDRDPDAWPEDAPAPYFDSKEHTPENDIPRRILPPDSPEVKRLEKTIFGGLPAPRLDSAWRYDPGSRELRRAKSWKDPERIFRNGLGGFPPDLDLAEALVERALDDGSQRKTLASFLHAYTDRDGNVFPSITLYDAWASGREIEMPDVDALGVVHTVLDDWKTWAAPVPSSQQDALYERIGELFAPARGHRALRRALAATCLEGSPVLREGGYETYLDNLHALWEDCRSTPDELVKRLPAEKDRKEFLAAWTKTCFEKGDLFQAGLARKKTLEKDGAATRALLVRLLAEFAPTARGEGAKR